MKFFDNLVSAFPLMASYTRVVAAPGFERPNSLTDTAENPFNPEGLNSHAIMKLIKYPPAPPGPGEEGLTLVADHRGDHWVADYPGAEKETGLEIGNKHPDTPRNSEEAFQNSLKRGAEAIEWDVQLSKDGVVVLNHDYTVGQEHGYGSTIGKPNFDPFRPRGHGADDPQALVNPLLKDVPSDQFTQAPYLHPQTRQNLEERGHTLVQSLEAYRAIKGEAVIFLDVKNADHFEKAWEVISTTKDHKGRPYSETVALKVSAAAFANPEEFKKTFSTTHLKGPGGEPDWKFVPIMPVFTTQQIGDERFDLEGKGRVGEHLVGEAYERYLDKNNYPGLVATELNLKQENGILSSLYLTDVQKVRQGERVTVGTFHPHSDVEDTRGVPGGGYYQQDGYCCITLQKFAFNGTPQGLPSDTADNRYNISFLLSNHNNSLGPQMITTDNAAGLVKKLTEIGQRNASLVAQMKLSMDELENSPSHALPQPGHESPPGNASPPEHESRPGRQYKYSDYAFYAGGGLTLAGAAYLIHKGWKRGLVRLPKLPHLPKLSDLLPQRRGEGHRDGERIAMQPLARQRADSLSSSSSEEFRSSLLAQPDEQPRATRQTRRDTALPDRTVKTGRAL